MPLEDLPDGFTSPTRNDIRDRFQRDYVLRRPNAATGEGSDALLDGSTLADAFMPLYANCASVARGIELEDKTRAQLQSDCRALGIPEELPPGASSGFVVITASSGGVAIDTTRLLKDDTRNLTFRCAQAGTYYDGKAVPIVAVDTGIQTNLPAGTRLKWASPPAGLGTIATVQADSNGDGLTGGRSAETDDDIRNRIRAAHAEAAVGGNVAQIRKLVKDAGRDLGIAIQEVFVYAGILGPGTYAFVFTLRPGGPGSTRTPSSDEIALVRDYLRNTTDGRVPGDDGTLAAELIEETVEARIGIKWAPKSVGWLDAQPWPIAADDYRVDGSTTAGPLAIDVYPSHTGSPIQPPQIGQTFALYDPRTGTFIRKRIVTIADAGLTGSSYPKLTLTIDATNNASDPNYVPGDADPISPWSDSLALIVDPFLTRIDQLGPGEQVDDFFDEGGRQKRMPENPLEWPSAIRHNDLDDVEALPQVLDVKWLAPDIPHEPSPGTAGASSNLVAIATIAVYPIA